MGTQCVKLFVIFTILSLHDIQGLPLNKAISYYETLHYNTDSLLQQHSNTKHTQKHRIYLSFHSHRNYFQVILHHDHNVFAPDVVIETSTGPVTYDITRTFHGYLQDEPETSYVHGVITSQGIFEGKIHSKKLNEAYTIERAMNHFNEPTGYHSVIYNHSSIRHELFKSECSSEILHYNIKDKLRNQSNAENHWTDRGGYKVDQGHGQDYHMEGKYSDKNLHHRLRRAIAPEKTMCELYVQADHLFYKERYKSNQETVIEQLSQHVQAINKIFKLIDFDGNAQQDDINFVIKKMKIWTDSTDSQYKLSSSNIGVEKYLELFSEYDFSAFCLGYMFTYRDFSGGTLGLAWTGDTSNAGGVCEKRNNYKGSQKSLNSGLVTVLNYGKDVPPSVSHLTMAHEVGHNMGSPHDPETGTEASTCFPSGSSGNYIMSARATSGDKVNNDDFSSCSIKSMHAVMTKKARDATDGCFKAFTASVCGNKILEAGEQCDCGWDTDCTEQCCFSQVNSPVAGQTPCMFKNSTTNTVVNDPSTFCSPSQGECCSAQCTFVSASENKQCRAAGKCTLAATCSGLSGSCPASNHKANKTSCDTGMVCYNGECTGSLCPVYNMESCICDPQKNGDYSDEKLCHLCCKDPSINANKCTSTYNLNSNNITGTKLQPGSPCYKYNGYCDSFLVCRAVDPSGPLSTLKNLFTNEGIANMKEWLIDNWFIPVSSFVGFIILLAIFVKLCNKKIPSHLEKAKKKKHNEGHSDDKGEGHTDKGHGHSDTHDMKEKKHRAKHESNRISHSPDAKGWV